MLSITPAAGFPPAIHANSDVTEVTVAFHSLLVVATTVQLVSTLKKARKEIKLQKLAKKLAQI